MEAIKKKMIDKIARHKELCDGLNALYAKKNHDYGDSFHLSFLEEGMAMPRIRLGDKLNRFKALSKDPESQKVQGESIRDTLLDLANYAIMTVLEMESESDADSDYNGPIRFKFEGEERQLILVGNMFDLYEPSCIICDVCVNSDTDSDKYPCEYCCHNDGDLEYFKLDERKVEIIE